MLRSSEIKPLVRQICHILWQVIFFIKALWYLLYNETWSFFYKCYLVPLVQRDLVVFLAMLLGTFGTTRLCRFFINVIWYLWYNKTLSFFYKCYLVPLVQRDLVVFLAMLLGTLVQRDFVVFLSMLFGTFGTTRLCRFFINVTWYLWYNKTFIKQKEKQQKNFFYTMRDSLYCWSAKCPIKYNCHHFA